MNDLDRGWREQIDVKLELLGQVLGFGIRRSEDRVERFSARIAFAIVKALAPPAVPDTTKTRPPSLRRVASCCRAPLLIAASNVRFSWITGTFGIGVINRLIFPKTVENLSDHFCGRGTFNQRHVEHDPSGILDRIAPDDFRNIPIRAFDKHIGNDGVNDTLRGWIIEYENAVDARQSRDHFGSFRFRHDRTRRSLYFPDGTIAVDSDDQNVTQRTRLIEIADVADVQNVKAAIGKNEFLAQFPETGSQLNDFFQGLDLANGHGNDRG